jgi:hypothetical protein
MSSLPQRKKSPEEIAKLRESLGIPGGATHENESLREEEPPVDTIVPTNHQATVVHENAPAELPKPAPQPVHSFKRSEQIAVVQETPAPVSDTVAPSAREPKPVRSLRKSERVPVEPHPESPPDSPLPHQRHSDREIAEIRRREALAVMNMPPNPKLFPAHPGVIIPGYLSATAGAAGFYFYQFPIVATLAFVAISLAVAAFIGIRKPMSRHHAAFISVISLFVLVFGALHYFPSLRHAT